MEIRELAVLVATVGGQAQGTTVTQHQTEDRTL